MYKGFPGNSASKESACKAGDTSSPGSGGFSGEGLGYPLQYSWASLVSQTVKNLPAIWETWVRSLGWEDPLEEGKVTHSYSPWGCKESDMTERLSLSLFTMPEAPGSIPGWGRSPGEGNGNPLQYSCLENPMDRGAWWATVHDRKELDMTERLSTHIVSMCTSFRGRIHSL